MLWIAVLSGAAGGAVGALLLLVLLPALGLHVLEPGGSAELGVPLLSLAAVIVLAVPRL